MQHRARRGESTTWILTSPRPTRPGTCHITTARKRESFFAFAAILSLLAGCGSQKQGADVEKRTTASTDQVFAAFTAVNSRELQYSSGNCCYNLSYDRADAIQVSKTCPGTIDANMTVKRTYRTLLEKAEQENLQSSLDRLQSQSLLTVYASTDAHLSDIDDYDFEFLTTEGKKFVVHIEGGSQENLPDGLLQIYQSVLDGTLRSMQNASDAIPDLTPVSDDTVANTSVKISQPHYSVGGAVGCTCDGNDVVYGFSSSSKTIAQDGMMEQWRGCLRRGTFTGDPNQGTRCHTDAVTNLSLPAAQWAAVKKMVLSADPLAFADSYPCGSYIQCPSDFDISGLTVDIGPAQRSTSWPTGSESQLPAKLQYLLSVLP